MFCPQCGHEAPKDANYCSRCGKALSVDSQEATTEERLQTCKVTMGSKGLWNISFEFVASVVDEQGEHEIARSETFTLWGGIHLFSKLDRNIFDVQTEMGIVAAPRHIPVAEAARNGLLKKLAEDGWTAVSFGSPHWWNATLVRHVPPEIAR